MSFTGDVRLTKNTITDAYEQRLRILHEEVNAIRDMVDVLRDEIIKGQKRLDKLERAVRAMAPLHAREPAA